jgi:hypothetical protein
MALYYSELVEAVVDWDLITAQKALTVAMGDFLAEREETAGVEQQLQVATQVVERTVL